MQNIFSKIEAFLKSNTVWVFLTLLLFLSYLLTVSVLKNTASSFVAVSWRMSLLFLPAAIFAFFRSSLQVMLSRFGFGLTWIFSYFIAPLLVVWKHRDCISFLIPENLYSYQLEDPNTFSLSFLATVAGSVFVTAIVLEMLAKYGAADRRKNWFGDWTIERLLQLVLVLMASLLALFHTIDLAEKAYPGLFILGFKWLTYTLQYCVIMAVYYGYFVVNKNFLIPKIFKTKGLIHYCFSVAAVILLTYPIFVFLIRLLPIIQELGLTNYSSPGFLASDGGAAPFFVILLSVPIIISNQWVQQSREIIALQKEKSEVELGLLKQQINPHFFFNTLNNLYALSITKDEQTPDVIMRLSELMRYVIYRGKEESVHLAEEIAYVEDYIKLQQIRLHKQLDFRFEKEIKNENMLVPPLLFITFVENAFKHGIEPAENNSFLHLKVKNVGNSVFFSCKNSIEEPAFEEKGIGLENFEQRLRLQFPDRHELMIDKGKDVFTATLRLDLIR